MVKRLALTATSIIVGSISLAFLVLPSVLTPTEVSLPYKAGDAGSYATGSSSNSVSTLQRKQS